MTPDRVAHLDEAGNLLTAACDEAAAAGLAVDSLIGADTPAELRDRLEDEFAWCRTVRRLLPGATLEDAVEAATPGLPSSSATPSLKKLGRFHIRRELGRGGYGIVFLAVDPELGREVALKVPRPEAIMHPELRARFQHEARATASLDHPNLVPVYETGEDGAVCYIASAYCPGTTLSVWLKERTEPVPFDLAARLVATLAEAVEHAHRRGILHRDLKPANVMLSPRNQASGLTRHGSESAGQRGLAPDCWLLTPETPFVPRIMDFGLAKVLDDEATTAAADFRTQSGAIVGTPMYMAPEQAGGQSRAIGPATDVYALGTILYELLCGRPPFRGDDTVETLVQVRTQEPLAPRRLRSKLPRDLETICVKSLHKDPRKRYGTAQALADDLHRYLTRQPIHARRVGVLGRVNLWCRRKPAQAITIGLAVLAVTVVAGVGLFQVLQERERYRDERDRAQANLYRSLVSEARALIQARDTAWWWKAMDNIHQAGTLEVADRDPGELRELAIQCMGTEHPCMRLHGTWEGHAGPITCTAFSKDGRLVASGSRDKTVRLWSVPDGRLIAVLNGHTQAVTGVAFHPAGKSIVSSCADGSVRLWDIASLERPESRPSTEVVEFHAGAVNALEWSPDGARLFAACADGTIQILTCKQGTSLANSERRTLSGHSGPVTCLAYSENGLLASGSQDKTIRVWDLPTGKETDVWATNDVPNTLDFDAGGHQLWWGQPESYSIVRRNLQSGRTIAYGMLHPGPVRQIRMGKSGLLTAASDGTVKWWTAHFAGGGDRLVEGAVARGAWGDARTFAVNANGNWIAAGYADGRLRLWEMAYPPQRTLVNSDRSAKQQAVFLGSEHVLVNAGWLHDFSRNWNEPAQGYFPESLSALAVHPAGRWFAYASEPGALAIGDRLRPDVRIACRGHAQGVSALVALSDGKRLASASADGSVKLWSWETGACQGTFEPNLGPLHALAWSADHHALAITGERGLTICEVDADPVVMRPIKQHALRQSSVAVFADFLASGGTDGAVEIWNFQTGRKLHALRGHKQLVAALAFSPDGKLLASAAANDTIRLWDVDKVFTEHAVIDAPSHASAWSPSLAFAPDGKYLAGSLTGPTRIWRLDAKSPMPIAELDGRPARFTADGSGLIAGAANGSVLEWAIADVVETRAQAQGKTEVAPSNFITQVRPPKTLVKGGHTHMIWGIAASPDGRWIASASADQTVKLWDARTRKLVRTLEGHTDMIWSVAFSPDSKYLASGSEDRGSGAIKIWEVATGKEHLHFQGHKRLVFGLAFHPNRPWLVSSSLDGSICLWDIAAGKAIGLLHQFDRAVYSVAFRPDGNWLAASCLDNRVALWELSALPNGAMPPSRHLEGHGASVYSVGFSSDGRFLATGSEQGQIMLWDADTFARITSLRAGTGQIRGISFSRDGQLLAGAAYGSATIVWDLTRVRRTLAEMNLDW